MTLGGLIAGAVGSIAGLLIAAWLDDRHLRRVAREFELDDTKH